MVQEWINQQCQRGRALRREVKGRLRWLIDWLEARRGRPDGNVLFDDGDGLCTAWFWFDQRDWAVAYYIADDGYPRLLRVIGMANIGEALEDLENARQLMQRCRDFRDRVEDL